MILGLITSWSKTYKLLLLQDQASGMDVVAADRWAPLKKRWALRGHAQVIWLSKLHV